MIEDLARRLSWYLVAQGAAEKKYREYIAYGIFHMLSMMQQIAILIVTGLFLGNLWQVAAFTLCFTSLKKYIGGAHASKHWACLTCYTVTAHGLCLLSSLIPSPYQALAANGLAVAMAVLVFAKAPVPHPNNPKNEAELCQLRKKAVTTAMLQLILIGCSFAVLPAEIAVYALHGAAGGAAAAASLLMPMPHPREETV